MKPLKTPFGVLAAAVLFSAAWSAPASAKQECMTMNGQQMCHDVPDAPSTSAAPRAFRTLGVSPSPTTTPPPDRSLGGDLHAGGTPTGDQLSPTGTCTQHPGPCYSDADLNRLADQVGVGDPQITQAAHDAINSRDRRFDVEPDDVQYFQQFFNGLITEKKIVKDKIGAYVQPQQLQDLMDHPEKIWTLRRDPAIPRTAWADFRKSRENLKQSMNAEMDPAKGDASNPLHVALMFSKDPWVKTIISGDGGGGDDHGHHHGGGEDGPMHPGSQWQQQEPQNPAAYVKGAEEAAEAGDLQGAAAQASTALSLDPNNLKALDIRGAANYDLHNVDDAKADANKALSLNPGDETAQAILNLAHDNALGASATKGLLSGMSKPSSEADGAVRAGSGAGAGAASLAVSAKSSASEAAAREAFAALAVGDSARALRAADAALASNPNNLQALNLRAMALLRQRQYSDALRSIDAGLAKDPSNRALLNTRAVALNKLHRYQEAEAQARALIAANPNDAAAWRSLSEALAGLGDRQGSLEALKRAAALDPRFNKTLETALQLPADADLSLLFSDDLGGAAAAPPIAGDKTRRLRRFGLIVGAALAAGLMIFIGAAPVLKKSMQNAWTRITRRGPSVGPTPQVIGRRASDLIKGQYRPGRQIGFGGMGMVYEGLDVSLQRTVAIKKMRDEIKADPRERARFIQEAKLVAALHHPAIVDIYAIAEEGDDVFLVFEFVKGKTLYDHVVARGRLSLDEALPILRGVVDGLEYAHGRGIIHRDLKPSNIMLNEEGGVKVMDFGIARVAKDALTKASQVMTNTIVGTPPYMAPEQEQGLVRKESDVYALALCLYEMLTGRMAFAGTGAGMLMSKINKAYAPVSTLAPELPAEMDAVFAAALEPEPGKRLSSPRELLERVTAVAAGRRG